MQGLVIRQVAAVLLLWCVSGAFVTHVADAEALPSLKFFHKFSEEAGRLLGNGWPAPRLNSKEHQQLLLQHDFARHGRKLASDGKLLTFANSNLTAFSIIDGLQYTIVDIGTPITNFTLALDTSSDLLWVPCQCRSCANPGTNSIFLTNRYVPKASNTSRNVTCGSSSCSADFSTCSALNTLSSGQCSYSISLDFDPNTTSSGTVFEDVLHLIPNSGPATPITSQILLGCGQNQTGNLLALDNSRTDGILGLGPSNYSVPSLLASANLVGDSFSMCFQVLGAGTIVFGDYGPPDLLTTPFVPPPAGSAASYYVGVDSITIGNFTVNETIRVNRSVLVDTGTYFTYLETPIYRRFLAAFQNNTAYPKASSAGSGYDLCFTTSDTTLAGAPNVFFNFRGDTSIPSFEFLVPTVSLATNEIVGFCVAILDGVDLNIIGAGFLGAYNVIFNREENVLGFDLEPDCGNYSTYPRSSAPKGSPLPSLTPPSLVADAPILQSPSTPGPAAGGPVPQTSSAPGLVLSLLSMMASSLFVTFFLHNLF